MEIAEILEAASLLVPEEVATQGDLTLADVWDHLAHDELEVALDLLQELGGVGTLPPAFWEALGDAAGRLGLGRSQAWCWWRFQEARVGTIRAELLLSPLGETFRRTPMPGAGVLRPMWDIGNLAPDGRPALNIAGLWVEFAPELPPGGRATVRLLPLDPTQWRRLAPGDVITLHEEARPGGTATILQVCGPAV
ncbi:hypothetical protein ACGFOU_12850 [Streptomyces sp. NPDC048595]|uniref:hypothetical protein n=1 Tax=Streptomyces sp. NPDC048595 TaxID=3365576 RepID=UPI003720E5F7